MQAHDLRIAAADGYGLAATLYEPERDTGDIAIIAGGMAISRRFYRRFAEFLAGRGVTALTFDYRGFGDSRPRSLRGFHATKSDYAFRDLPGVIDWATRHGARRLLYVAHSMGGQVAGLAPNHARIARAVFIAAPSGYWRNWPRPQRYVLAAIWYGVMPAAARTLGYIPGRRLGFGEDLPAGVALEWASHCRRPHYVAGPEGSARRNSFDAFRAPILAWAFTDDGYAPRRSVEALLGFYRNAPRELRVVAPADLGVRRVAHFGFFREEFMPTLWQPLARWLVDERD